MRLLVSQKILKVWKEELLKAKHKEIGGVLFGEHVGDEEFRLVEFTMQRKGGGEVSFKRRGREASRSLKRLSKAYGNNHSRFNYLGEWHSHPNAPVHPSALDCQTMQSLLGDKATDANFLVLLILKANERQDLEISASTFLASGHILDCEIELSD